MGLSVITCTGGRPEAFALCQRWLSRQTFQGCVQWVVVDDCFPHQRIERMPENFTVDVIHPSVYWQPGSITLARNMLLGLSQARGEKIIVVEDDDYIDPRYLKTMERALEAYSVVGQYPARYYHIGTRQYRDWGNIRHASLGQTGLRAEAIPELTNACKSEPFIDLALWRSVRGWLFSSSDVIGIKGLPGRPGIGIGHRPRAHWPVDADSSVLRSWVGGDAEVYERYQEKAAA